MRFILKLKAIKEKEFSYNYNFPLSGEINKLLGFNKPEFLEYLTKKGIKLSGRSFNLFTFALSFENVYRRGKKLFLRSNNASLLISVPGIIDEYLNEISHESITGKHITILKNYPNAILNIKNMIVLPEPDFKDEMHLVPLSPFVMTFRKNVGPKVMFISLSYRDNPEDIEKHINDNLSYKYRTLYNENIKTGKLQFEWDQEVISERLQTGKRLTAKLSVEFGTKKSSIIGSMVPFTLRGNKELIKAGYECGFGDMNSLGFGMTDIVQQ